MTNRPIPYDEGAEGALLGAMLLSPSAIETAERTLVSSDFYSPAHLRIFDAILELHAVGAAVDPKTVASHIGDLAPIGGPDKLIALIANVPAISSAATYAGKIKECSNLRRISRASNDTMARIDAGLDAAEVLDRLTEDLGTVELAGSGRSLLLEDFEDLVAAPEEDLPDWVIPGMMRRRHRMMITAPTKTGKMTMIRQIGFCASRGMHPFTRDPIEPQRVLMLDLENPRDTYVDPVLKAMVQRLELYDKGDRNLKIVARDQGMNLLARADRLLLEDALRNYRPDILCICPVYKSFTKKGNEDAEALTREICDVYDHLRSTYDCALILEHHSPRGSDNLFPFGSSVWERWVDFGRTMRMTEGNSQYIEWGSFCASDRIPVTWPKGFRWGTRGLPFDPDWGDQRVEA